MERELQAMMAAYEVLEPLDAEERQRAIQWLSHKLDVHDIEAVAFLVLMQAAASANEDLKAIVRSVRAAEAQRRRGGFDPPPGDD